MTPPESDPQPLRVLHVYRTYFPETMGGLLEVVRQICHSTGALGVSNRIFTLARNPNPTVLERDEADVYRYPLHMEVLSMSISATALGGFRALVHWADVVNYHFPWPFADVLHVLGRVSTPSVLTYHSDIVKQRGLLLLYRPLMHWFLGRMGRIVATSPRYVETSPVLQRFAQKVEAISLALDETTYRVPDPSAIAAVRKRVGEGFFLFVGVLRYYKGLDILLDSVAGTNIRLVVAGTGPKEDSLKSRIAKQGLRNVTMLGFVTDDDKAALMQLCKAIVLPSHLRSEAFGIVLLEGAMFGKPLISCEIGTGTSYVNRDGETGIVVAPRDAVALRQAMVRLDEDAALAQRMGRGARARYESLFTGPVMGEQYVRLYERIARISKSSSGVVP
jgi:glycosyltransferase involved in cell wall biosynthesis